jgi:PKD repeat protein
MIPNVRRRSSLLALTGFFLCSLLPAATYLPMSDADLARLAPTVVRAEVVEQTVRVDRVGDQDLPFTVVTLRPLETFKGEVGGQTFRVRLPGGMVGGRAWSIPGTPTFQTGQEVVLMLDHIADGSTDLRLTEFGLSRFDLVTDAAGRRFAVRPAFSAEADLQLSRVGSPLEALAFGDPAAVPSRDAESFLSALRALSRTGQASPVAYAVPTGGFGRRPGGSFHTEWTNIGGDEPNNEFRWFWDTGDSPTATAVITGTQSNLATDDSCGTDSTCYVQNVVTGWHGVAQTDVRIDGPSSTGNLKMLLDAAMSQDNGVTWNTPFGCSGGVIGLGGPDSSPFFGPFKGDAPFYAIPSGTVSMRQDTCANPKYSGKVFKCAILHETGHALGLGHPGTDPSHNESTSIHSSTPSDSWLTAVMHWSIPPSTPSTPQTDDIQAIQYFYGTVATGPMAPVANFSFSPTNPVSQSPVNFTDSSTNSPSGYSWDFGDSSPISHDRNPSHTFASAGSYAVKLYAGNFNGTGTATKTVAVAAGGGPSVCTPNTTTLCLNASRFQVTADWEKKDGTQGHGTAISLTSDTGYFWFFNSSNIEVVTKVLAFCTNPFNAYWIFAAGLTDVKVTLTYTDTKNGTVVPKQNPQGTAFVAIQDTAAFKTCP